MSEGGEGVIINCYVLGLLRNWFIVNKQTMVNSDFTNLAFLPFFPAKEIQTFFTMWSSNNTLVGVYVNTMKTTFLYKMYSDF